MKMLAAMFLGFISVGASFGYVAAVGFPIPTAAGVISAVAGGLGVSVVIITATAREYGVDA